LGFISSSIAVRDQLEARKLLYILGVRTRSAGRHRNRKPPNRRDHSAIEGTTRRDPQQWAAQQTRASADLLTQRQVVASELADLRVRFTAIDAQRQRVGRMLSQTEAGKVLAPGSYCPLFHGAIVTSEQHTR